MKKTMPGRQFMVVEIKEKRAMLTVFYRIKCWGDGDYDADILGVVDCNLEEWRKEYKEIVEQVRKDEKLKDLQIDALYPLPPTPTCNNPFCKGGKDVLCEHINKEDVIKYHGLIALRRQERANLDFESVMSWEDFVSSKLEDCGVVFKPERID